MHPTRYFSPIHASKASQLFGAPVEVADSDEITALGAALTDYPDDYNLRLQLAQALGHQLRYREAILLLTAAVELDPDCTVAYRKRAPRYFSTLQFQAAYEDYSYCALRTPGSLDLLYRLGIVCVAMGRYEEAKRCMTRCIELTENDGEMRVAAIYWYLAAYLRCHTPGEPNRGALSYQATMDVGHHFAYRAGVELLCGLTGPEAALAVIDDTVDDLDYSMIQYAVYLHHVTRGEAAAAEQAMESLLARDYYWAGFAHICAYADRHGVNCGQTLLPAGVPWELYNYFTENPKLAVAFSGGADSSYLLYAAKACGCTVKGYYVSSAFQPQFEQDDAQRLAAELGVALELIPLNLLSNDTVRGNPPDRCYHCKRAIFGRLAAAAAADGFSLLVDGTNASDDAGDRPGMRALTELKVVSPLRVVGITKARLRDYSRRAGLFTWDKPAYACLATRIPTGTPIDADTLTRVERGEALLTANGFIDFRLRVAGDTAKLQLWEEQMGDLMEKRSELYTALSAYFTNVTLDLNPRSKGE